ncbi:MAG: hypothetical protein WA459_01610 [Stellaceae bacterium]
MQSGNGIDLAAVYQLLLGMSGRLDGMSGRLDDVFARLDVHERKLDDVAAGLSDLRAAVTNYHGAVLGHGIMLSELDERVRRIERHLKLESAGE